MPASFTRRQLAQLARASALGLAVHPAASVAAKAAAGPGSASAASFPPGFVWGTATSAYQVEGAVEADGRGRSIWDQFAQTPGRITDGSNADQAADHYHRYREDIGLMRELGVTAYRFSIAWPRVFPDGDGRPNPKGLDFYERLVDQLLDSGIAPFATLYHWDLPQSLQDRFGGWRSAATASAFADYAGHVARRLSDRVQHFFTLNECARFVNFGYGNGLNAPGLRLTAAELNQVRHHAALGHGLAVQAIRAGGHAGVKVGTAENMAACLPAIGSAEHVRAAELATRELNADFLTLILEGRYTDHYLAAAGRDAPVHSAEELRIIGSPLDFIGLNIYTPHAYVVASAREPGFELLPVPGSFPHMNADWLRIVPETAYWVPRLAAKLWGLETIYISENGTSAADAVTAEGRVDDLDRIMFLRNYLAQLQRATAEGVPVRGYFLWSLLDNFEWTDGFAQRFGLYRVDFETQARTPKLSAAFYRDVVARNAIGS